MRLVLKPDQKEHVERLVQILQKTYAAFDLSTMGTGKTYTTSKIAKEFDFTNIIVVCPSTVVSKWEQMEKYGIRLYKVLSYESLRSVKNKNPKHGLLTRNDDESSPRFEPTNLLDELIDDNLFVIFDEAQKIKNTNAQWHACRAIAEAILISGGLSRFILLSGTPIDKQEQSINIMKMMGFIRSDKLAVHNKMTNSLTLYGLQELIYYCEKLDKTKTQTILAQNEMSFKNVEKISYLLFQEVVKLNIASAMENFNVGDVFLDIKNAEYRIDNYMDEELLKKATDAVNETFERFKKMQRLALDNLNPNENKKALELKQKLLEERNKKIHSINHNMRLIELGKIHLFLRLAKRKLKENSHYKVCLFVNYTESIERLQKGLQEFQPIVLDGAVPVSDRYELLQKFQESNQKHRVLIGNIRVCSSGLDIDDKSSGGKFPRFVYANPNWSILDLQQLPYRFLRRNTTSSTKFRFVYAKKHLETGLLANLRKKAEVMKDTAKDVISEAEEKVYVGSLEMVDGDEEF